MSTGQNPDAFEEQVSRYIVGIDLGTTNCAVAYVDSERKADGIRVIPMLQWVDFGTEERRDLLPSFLYQPLASERQLLVEAGAGKDLTHVVGGLARDRGLQLPGRQVASAKSWLCHDGVDRKSPILPWQSDDDVEKLSPVEASARYLRQIRRNWDATFKSYPLAEQDVVLTLPASFDQVVRQLTIEAAAEAGLKRVLPIEEPQAAFYAWLARHSQNTPAGQAWESLVRSGETILVCDIGGGTTDFTLIRVRETTERDTTQPEATDVNLLEQAAHEVPETLDAAHRRTLSLHRVAVGQHLILGGDNIDLALSKLAEQKLSPQSPLPPRDWDALRQACRVAKETLLGEQPPAAYTVNLPGSGSRLVGGSRRVEIGRDEVEHSVLDGFFPKTRLFDRPAGQQSGFQEYGLPFATDAGITRHLAAFLWDHRHVGRTDAELSELSDVLAAKPDWILFNGGVMTSSQLRTRLVEVVASWFAGQDQCSSEWSPGVLEGESLDKAVAIGAAYFGQVRRGEGVAIEAKLACSYYLQTQGEPPRAVCIVPGAASPGDQFELSEVSFELELGQPVQFPLLYSTTRLADRPGEFVELNPENFCTLPPIRTVLEMSRTRQRQAIPVVIETELTQIGTLQMYCHATGSEHRWKLEFDVRGSTQTDLESSESFATQAGTLDEAAERTAWEVLEQVFVAEGRLQPSKLMQQLAERLQLRRGDWPPSLLRSMWQALMQLQAGRSQSAAHEARWLNLLGYVLRPGYGMAADDWRVAQTWRAVHGKLAFPAVTSRNESLILWRRIAGGFTAGQQLTVYQQIAGPLRGVLDPTRRAKGGGGTAVNELTELLRLVGSLELLPKSEKTQLGRWLLGLLRVKKWASCQSSVLWAIGRLGSRVPTYGPLNCVVDVGEVSNWLVQMCESRVRDPNLALAMMLCSRRVNDRYRDVPDQLRSQVLSKLEELSAPPHYAALVREAGKLASEEANQILGEALPLGLRLA